MYHTDNRVPWSVGRVSECMAGFWVSGTVVLTGDWLGDAGGQAGGQTDGRKDGRTD